MSRNSLCLWIMTCICGFALAQEKLGGRLPYCVVDTGQDLCFDNSREIAPPKPGQAFFGQDAQFTSHPASYKDNGDGTISDLNTGLMWVKARGPNVNWEQAQNGAKTCRVGGHGDWRMPSIKELYSLINFNGGCDGSLQTSRPYIDTRYFEFVYGDESKGQRIIDSQDYSATSSLGSIMMGNPCAYGVNFADGRIKSYPKSNPPGRGSHFYVRYVRGNPGYGKNDFHDNNDGTISDLASGLMWTKTDSGKGMNWQDALAYASKNRTAGHSDWRLPSAKELQSLVDYTHVPAIDSKFQISRLEDGEYPFYWSSTTHLEGPRDRQPRAAVYVAFGRGTGWMQFPPGQGEYRLLDVHGAGCQRSDPKTGDAADFPHGRGPQGDVIRINNHVRCVRTIR